MSSSALKVRDHRLGIGQRRLEQSPGLGAAGMLQQRHLDARTQAVERGAQIVRDVVGHLAHAAEQPLDLIEHGIQVGCELVKLVARALERDPLTEIARHDPARRAIDRIDPPEHPAAHQEAAGEPEQQRESEAPAQRAPDLRLDLQPVLDVAPDQQTEAAGQQEARRTRRGGAGRFRHRP